MSHPIQIIISLPSPPSSLSLAGPFPSSRLHSFLSIFSTEAPFFRKTSSPHSLPNLRSFNQPTTANMKFFVPLALLAVGVSAATTVSTAASASSTACDADYIVTQCLETEEKKPSLCDATDYSCLCAAYQAIATYVSPSEYPPFPRIQTNTPQLLQQLPRRPPWCFRPEPGHRQLRERLHLQHHQQEVHQDCRCRLWCLRDCHHHCCRR